MTNLQACWSRRTWLTQQTAALAALATARGVRVGRHRIAPRVSAAQAARMLQQAERLDAPPVEATAQHAVDAARAAGATYADARLTRKVGHLYYFGGMGQEVESDVEHIGVGVRALVDGAWGFSAGPWWTPDDVVSLAQDAVAQARVNARGATVRVELGPPLPAAVGRWTTPIQIDPFAVPVEEKLDLLQYWQLLLHEHQLNDGGLIGQLGWLSFVREERVVATTDGTCFTQTTYETGGQFHTGPAGTNDTSVELQGLHPSGQGYELFLNAHIPEQITTVLDTFRTRAAIGSKPATVGRYTVVCDGATMASLLARTLGVATQLDRALGYEANAGGTSFIDDPLAMVGQLAVASPLVTITANRSAPTQLATVKWDDEGVLPQPFPLVKDGILVDFQTTRAQAAWLAPYYAKTGQPVTSHGCAGSEDALMTPLQMAPNLAMVPGTAGVRLEDVVSTVRDGILLEGGEASRVDFQLKGGTLGGTMREITNGKLGKQLYGCHFKFSTVPLWSHVMAIGGPETIQTIPVDPVATSGFHYGHRGEGKGEPAQKTTSSASGIAAVIPNVPLVR